MRLSAEKIILKFLTIFILPCLIVFLIIIDNGYSYVAKKYYTIQAGSFIRLEGAHELFDYLAQKLNRKELSNLRIEKGEKYYTVRFGKFKSMATTRNVSRMIESLSPGAFILKDYIEDKRIIRQYDRTMPAKISGTGEKSLTPAKADEVKQEVYLKPALQVKTESSGKPMKEVSNDSRKEDRTISASPVDLWSLQRCIDYAIQNNPDLQSSEAKIKVSTYHYDSQTGLFFPQLDLNVSTGYLAGKPISPFAILGGITEQGLRSKNVIGQYISASPSLNVPILREGVLFARNAPSLNIASDQILIDKSMYEAKKNELTYGIGRTFLNVLKNKEESGAAEEHVKYLKYVHTIALSKYNESLISKNDLLMSEVKLASGEKELTTARNSSKLFAAELSTKMGLEPMKGIPLSVEDFTLPPLPPLEELIETALLSRHEIKAQELQITVVKEQERQAKSQKYPNIDLISTYALANDYGSRLNSLWEASLQLSVPIFDFDVIKSKVMSQGAKVTEEEKRLQSIKADIAQEVIEAFTNIENTKAEITLNEKMIEQSRENVRLMKAQFGQNLTPLSSLLEAEYTLYAQQKALSQAKYNLRNAYLELSKATGSKLTYSFP
jgi:outer membrane protein